MRSFACMPAVQTPEAPQDTCLGAPCDFAFSIERQGRLLQPRSISGLFLRSLSSGLQPPCLRFAGTATGHHARLGTQLLAKLYRGRHFRRLYLMRLQGATLTEPYVNLSIHTAPIVQPLAYRPTASAQTDTAAPSNRTYPAARPPFMAFKLFVFPHGPFG